MITIDVLVTQLDGLQRADLEQWVASDWVRAETVGGLLSFGDIDIARATLIHALRSDLEVSDATLPIVLSLIDQLYDMRRQVRQLGEVMQEAVPSEILADISYRLAARTRLVRQRLA